MELVGHATGETYEATAVVLQRLERDRLFAATTERYPFVADFRRRRDRQIPVVASTRYGAR